MFSVELEILFCHSYVRLTQCDRKFTRVDVLGVVAEKDDLFPLRSPRAKVFEEASVSFHAWVAVMDLLAFELSHVLREHCLSAFFGAACRDSSFGL